MDFVFKVVVSIALSQAIIWGWDLPLAEAIAVSIVTPLVVWFLVDQ